MADDDDAIFDVRSAKLVAIVTRMVLGQLRGRPDLSAPRVRWTPIAWHSFYNTSGEDIPPHAIMKVGTTFTWLDVDQPFYQCSKPDTTLGSYAICDEEGCKSGQTGRCTFEGPVRQLCEDASPTAQAGYGPKPNQWSQAKGYPRTSTVDGVVSSSQKHFWGEFSPIRTLLGKSSSDIAAASGTSTVTPGSGTVKIWVDTGSGYVESSGPMTFTGYNVSTTAAVSSGVLTRFAEIGGRLVAQIDGGGQRLVKTTSTIASGASGTVNIWNGGSGGSESVSSGPITATAWNRTSVSIASGKFCLMTPLSIGGAIVNYLEPWEC